IGFSGTGRRTTTRLLDAQFPPYRTLLPQEFAVTAEVPVASLSEAVKRVALVAERGNPVRLQSGDGITTAFNPSFLLEGLGAIEEPVARLLFTTPTKPAVLRPAGGASDYTYLIMPVRLPG